MIKGVGRNQAPKQQMHPRRDMLSETRGALLGVLRRHGPLSAAGVARRLHVSREAARQQLALLEEQGLVSRAATTTTGRGRPRVAFALTDRGDGLFPKNYDTLSLALLDLVTAQFGTEGLTRLLAALADLQVQYHQPRLQGMALADRLEALKGIYFIDDPYTSVRRDRRGLALVEHNCPYLSLALQRPHLCSVTVSVLSRLLGVRVARERRFQDGDGRCVFRIMADQPVNAAEFRFAYEEVPKPD